MIRALALLLLLAACSRQPGGTVSADEASQLNAAADRLDANATAANTQDPVP